MARWTLRAPLARRTVIAVAVTLLVSAAAGCAPVASTTEEPAAQQTEPAPSPAPPAPGPVGPVAPDEPSEPDPVLSWVPPGPASPGDPPEQSWYLLLRDRDCAALDAAVRAGFEAPLWTAAATTCAAMAGGGDAVWAEAKAQVDALDPPPEDPGSGACHGAAVQVALQRALAFHAEHPEVEVVTTAPADGVACKLVLNGVILQEPAEDGHFCGSRWYVLDGRLLPTTVLTVDGSSDGLNLTVGAREHLFFEMPVGTPGQESTIQAATPDGEVLGTVDFVYPEPDVCESPSPEPSASPSE